MTTTEVLVHSKAELIAAVQMLDLSDSPLYIMLWRESGITEFRFPQEFGRYYTGYVRFGVTEQKERTPDEVEAWRKKRLKRILTDIRKIPERELLA